MVDNPVPVRPKYRRLHATIEKPLQVLVPLAALATIPIIIAQERGYHTQLVTAADWAIWTTFFVDVVLATLCAADRWSQVRRSWVGVAVVVLSFPLLPALLATVRIVRVARLASLARLFRLLAVTARGVRALRHSIGGQSLLYVSALSAFLTISGGALLTFIEPQTVEHGIWDGLWWAMVTLTTVGYGDIAPETIGGRLLAIVLMLCGVGLISTLAASISAYFVGENEQADLAELRDRLDRMERKLDQLIRQQER